MNIRSGRMVLVLSAVLISNSVLPRYCSPLYRTTSAHIGNWTEPYENWNGVNGSKPWKKLERQSRVAKRPEGGFGSVEYSSAEDEYERKRKKRERRCR
jgi:hypothetical protein